MCHFLAPAGQPEMMRKNFMHRNLRIFVVQCLCMKFYAYLFSQSSPCKRMMTIRTGSTHWK